MLQMDRSSQALETRDSMTTKLCSLFSTRRPHGGTGPPVAIADDEIGLLNKNKIFQWMGKQICGSRTARVLTASGSTVERTIKNSAFMVQDEVEKCLSSVIPNKKRISKDVLNSSGRYGAKVNECSPRGFQLLLELLGDTLQTRERMLSQEPVEVFRITGTSWRYFLIIRSPLLAGSGY